MITWMKLWWKCLWADTCMKHPTTKKVVVDVYQTGVAMSCLLCHPDEKEYREN